MPSWDLAHPTLELAPPAARDGEFRRGVSLALPGSADGNDEQRQPVYGRLLDELVALGASDLELVVEWSQTDVRAIEMTPHPLKTVDDDLLRWVMDAARERKLRVFLSPQLSIDQTEPGHTVPEPEDFERWWWSYRRFVHHYARMADGHGAVLFSIGHDLQVAEAHPDQVRELMTTVRKIYEGPVTYVTPAARVESVGFWDALDVITARLRPSDLPDSDATLDAQLRDVMRKVMATSKTTGRPFVVSDAIEAVRLEEDAADATPARLREALRYERALYRTLARETSPLGVFSAGFRLPGHLHKDRTTPLAAPAAQVLSSWFRGSRATAQAQGLSAPTSQVAK